MTRTFIRYYCCKWCEGSKQHMKHNNRSRRKLNAIHRRYIRLLRRTNRQNLRKENYEHTIISYDRFS